jgi:aryl-alcohol dehydrogenase (NADP+)
MARPSITAPIASATTTEQLHDIVGALKLNLDTSSLKLLNEASQV